ncbi:MAG: hypothetical protein QXV62_04845 [Nitrososphaerota archaeon]
MSDSEIVLDLHKERFGKRAEDVKYSEEICQFCKSRVDEFGFCACGGQAD